MFEDDFVSIQVILNVAISSHSGPDLKWYSGFPPPIIWLKRPDTSQPKSN